MILLRNFLCDVMLSTHAVASGSTFCVLKTKMPSFSLKKDQGHAAVYAKLYSFLFLCHCKRVN